MSNFIQEHLKNINVDNLMDFRSNAFISMASTSCKCGSYELGVNAVGQFVVKTKDERFSFNNPIDAIDKYSELLNEK